MPEIHEMPLRVWEIQKVLRDEKNLSKKLLKINLDRTKRIFPIDYVLFQPDGYIHGKSIRAISGWLVDKNGGKFIRAFLKVQKMSSPSEYTTRLVMPGVNIAEHGSGTVRATLQLALVVIWY